MEGKSVVATILSQEQDLGKRHREAAVAAQVL
jgi:hypothetical protein